MAGDIRYYRYHQPEIIIKGLCNKGLNIHFAGAPYGYNKLICESKHYLEPTCGFYTLYLRPRETALKEPTPHCLPCLMNLIEMGFNRTMVRHESRYESRKGARKKLQYVWLIHE